MYKNERKNNKFAHHVQWDFLGRNDVQTLCFLEFLIDKNAKKFHAKINLVVEREKLLLLLLDSKKRV